MVHWYANVPAVGKVREAVPVVKLGTFAGAPVTWPKVTLCAVPELLVQVTASVASIVIEDGLKVLLLVIATELPSPGSVESLQPTRARMSQNARKFDTYPPMGAT